MRPPQASQLFRGYGVVVAWRQHMAPQLTERDGEALRGLVCELTRFGRSKPLDDARQIVTVYGQPAAVVAAPLCLSHKYAVIGAYRALLAEHKTYLRMCASLAARLEQCLRHPNDGAWDETVK